MCSLPWTPTIKWNTWTKIIMIQAELHQKIPINKTEYDISPFSACHIQQISNYRTNSFSISTSIIRHTLLKKNNNSSSHTNTHTLPVTHSSVLRAGPAPLPESESFWSPLAPTVKGSFLLGAFSFISLTPSLWSNLGVLFDEPLSLS